MNETNQKAAEINPSELQSLRSVLKQITSLAKEASLTGSLEKGSRSAAQQYNRIIKILQDKGVDLGGLFEPLSEDVSFDEIGVSAAQLAGYIENAVQYGTPPVPPVPPVPPLPPVPPMAPEPPQNFVSNFDFALEIGSLKELDKLKGLGQMIREQLPEWIKQEVAAKMGAAHEYSQGEKKEKSTSGDEVVTDATDQEATATGTSEMQSKHATRRLEDDAQHRQNFSEMNMAGARFSDTNLAESAFSDVNFAKVEFTDVNFGDVVFADCNMAGARFSDNSFSGASFSDSDFNGVSFSDSTLNRVSFTESSLTDASFSEVDLSNTRFHNARFQNVELNDCDISGMKINGIAVEELLRNHRPQ